MTARSTLWVRGAATAVAVVCLAAGLASGTSPDSAAGDGLPVVLVSGRDDHGVVVTDSVPMHDAPDGQVVGHLDTETLVQVHEEQPPWLRVTSLEGPRRTGWVDDFVLRGALHTVRPDAPACDVPTAQGGLSASSQVRVVDLHETPTGMQIGVVALTGGPEHHVPRDWVRELAGPRAAGRTPCASVVDPEEPVHRH